MAVPTGKQQKLFDFLKANSDNGRSFSIEEVCAATTYKPTAIAPNASKGLIPWLVRTKPKTYVVKGFKKVGMKDFLAALSQVKATGVVTRKVPVTEKDFLVEGAAQEFQLAIELFNRPTTPNRIEAFTIHFIQAWEKLLKARLIERDGPEAIWNKGPERTTIGLQKALHELYAPDDKVRLNVQRIADLRDDATHYMLPALDAIASRYFQSGVMNFFREFRAFAGEPPLQMYGVGLMSLVFDAPDHTSATLQQHFGAERAMRIVKRIQELEQAAMAMNDPAYAIPLNLSVGFVDKNSHPEQTIAGLTGMTPVVVAKTLDPKKSHPHEVRHVLEAVNKRLTERYSEDGIRKLLGRPNIRFNKDDFSSISDKEGWKVSSNKFHFDHGTTVQHTYSDECIEFILDKLTREPGYLKKAKTGLASKRRPKRKK
jgi:hypothetical protein